MISRCPSCGIPAPDEARLCRTCGWDFFTNKKSEPPAAKPPSSAPVSSAPGGFSLPPARGGDAPASKPGTDKAPKAERGPYAAPAGAESPFALPVARNLGPKPGESLFASPPPEQKGESLPAAPPSPDPKDEPEVLESDEPPPAPALFLPTSNRDILVEPSVRRPSADKGAAKQPEGPAGPRHGRQAAVYLAALAGGALGLLSVGAIFVMLHADPQGSARPASSAPFGKHNSGDASLTPSLEEPGASSASMPMPTAPAPSSGIEAAQPQSLPGPIVRKPVEPPKPVKENFPVPAAAPEPPPPRPTATFAKVERPQPAPAPKQKPKPAPAAPVKPKGPQWAFSGVVYDLLTTQGVFGVRLSFLDSEDNEIASTETGTDGSYGVSMRPGPKEGYTVRIISDDYSGKHIDELDSTSSVRKADLEQRKFLMQAGARSLPWIGVVGKPIRRDMALVSRVSEE